MIKELSGINTPVDYTLVIRADFINQTALTCLKEKSKKLFAYQWDGYKRSAAAEKLIHLFDDFFVFDSDDYKRYSKSFSNIRFITNFYLDNEPKSGISDGSVFFVGRYLKERESSISRIAEFFRKKESSLILTLLLVQKV
ncbi:hypothetical protein [Niabella ginsengisoli]|uniref:Uncharacterized protein n=1 Tax=Niabella ginsengisoli TaxID=522298 RepID=A0ABS9SN61_9BACT|nr:hypothetical protein [Niabella ginsengisoli]MCH5599706.1 hypothetical protein [Niabella ginsengisoli]